LERGIESNVAQSSDQQGVAIGRSDSGSLRADQGAATGAILDHERPPELSAQAIGKDAADEVEAAARR
jgi:hypothetical protein